MRQSILKEMRAGGDWGVRTEVIGVRAGGDRCVRVTVSKPVLLEGVYELLG